MKSSESSLKKRYLFKLMTNFVGLGVGLFTQTLVPRSLGPSSYGNYSFLTNFFIQLTGFLNMNSSTAFYTKLSQREDDRGLVSFYVYVQIIIGMLVFLFISTSFMTGIDKFIWPKQEQLFVFIAAVWVMLQLFSNSLIQISDAFALTIKSETVNMLQKILGLLIILVLFWASRLNLLNYFIFQMSMFCVIIVSLTVILKKHKEEFLKHWRLKKKEVKSYINEFAAYCLPLVIFYFFSVLEQMLDRWLIQKFSGSVQQGFYSLAYQIGSICFLFVSALIPLIMREFAVSFANNDIEKNRQIYEKYIKMTFAIAAFFGCFLAVEAENVLLIFGGEAYIGAVIPISVMCFYPIHQTYGQMNSAFFFATARTKTFSKIGLSLFFIGLPLSIFLLGPSEYGALEAGAIGLSIKMIIIQLIAVNIQLWFNTRFLDLSFRKFIVHQIFVLVGFFLIASGCSYIVNLFFNKFHFLVHFFISGIIYTVFHLIIIFIYPHVWSIEKTEMRKLVLLVKNKLIK